MDIVFEFANDTQITHTSVRNSILNANTLNSSNPPASLMFDYGW